MVMTQEEIKEYNQLCAEFLGMYDYFIDNTYFDKGKYFCYPEKEKNPPCGYFYVRTCFVEDWNWIMEVVERIESLGYSFTIGNNHASIWKGGSAIVSSNAKIKQSKKEAVVQAIYQFLKWYKNENKN